MARTRDAFTPTAMELFLLKHLTRAGRHGLKKETLRWLCKEHGFPENSVRSSLETLRRVGWVRRADAAGKTWRLGLLPPGVQGT